MTNHQTKVLDTLITNKTRIKLLLRFFLNPSSRSYLRSLATEFDESTNAIRLELNRFEDAGMLQSDSVGNRKIFKANVKHPLYQEVRSILLKYVGVDQLIERVITKLGDIREVYLTGDFARGKNSDVIDITIIGNVDRLFLSQLIEKAEDVISKKIRHLVYSPSEFQAMELDKEENLLIWNG
ncbi:MAG: ArsR family transcriptional regulator [Bacteroidota bacterium]